MLILGILSILLSLIIIPFAWRGRVIAQGQFCRKCDLARQFCQGLSVSPVRLAYEIQEPKSDFGRAILELRMKFDAVPASIALRSYIRFDDGQLIEFGKWVQQGPNPKAKGASTHWPMNPYDMERYTFAKPILERFIEQGHIGILFKTDATLAASKPQIQQVLDFSLVFENLPLQLIQDHTKVRAMPPEVKKIQWIQGACTIDMPKDSP